MIVLVLLASQVLTIHREGFDFTGFNELEVSHLVSGSSGSSVPVSICIKTC